MTVKEAVTVCYFIHMANAIVGHVGLDDSEKLQINDMYWQAQRDLWALMKSVDDSCAKETP